MPEINTRNPEPFEIVGSKDLRESFKERGRIRGSWFINGIEMHQFEATSPASVVALINAKSSGHFVTAEIDDGGHLVLIDRSGHPIAVRAGAEFVDPPPASTGDAAKDIAAAMRHEQDRQRYDRDRGNDVLDMLGLDVTDKSEIAAAPQPGFETGRSAEDRRKAREEELARQASPAQPAYPSRAANPAGGLVMPVQDPTNPTPGGTTGSQGRLDDGRGRTGTGGGQGESAAATIQQTHQSQRPAPVPGA